jgi:hypothetical protein
MSTCANLITALGSNASIYETIALKIVDLIDAEAAFLEVGVIALKTAQLILDSQERDAWDSPLKNMQQTSFFVSRDATRCSSLVTVCFNRVEFSPDLLGDFFY